MKNKFLLLSMIFTTAYLLVDSIALSQEGQIDLRAKLMDNRQRIAKPSQLEIRPTKNKVLNSTSTSNAQGNFILQRLKDKLERTQFQKLEGVNDLGGGDIVEVGGVTVLKHFRRVLAMHLRALKDQNILTKNIFERALKLTDSKDKERISFVSFSDPLGPFLKVSQYGSPATIEINEWLWWRTTFEEREKFIFLAFLEILNGSRQYQNNLMAQLFPIFSMMRLRYHRFDFISRDQVKINLDNENIKKINVAPEENNKIFLQISNFSNSMDKKIELNPNHPVFSIFNSADFPDKDGLNILLGNSFKLSLFKKSIVNCESRVRNGELPKTLWTLDSSNLVVLCVF